MGTVMSGDSKLLGLSGRCLFTTTVMELGSSMLKKGVRAGLGVGVDVAVDLAVAVCVAVGVDVAMSTLPVVQPARKTEAINTELSAVVLRIIRTGFPDRMLHAFR